MLDTEKGIRAEILQYVLKASVGGDGYLRGLNELAKELNFDMRFIRKGLERTLILDSPPMVITQIVGSTHGQLQLFLQVPRDAGFRYGTPAQELINEIHPP